MKIWTGYGSEHSTNLKMIGHFADESAAKAAMLLFERIKERVYIDMDGENYDPGEGAPDLTDEMGQLLRELNIWSLGPTDVENFAYDHSVARDGADVILTTDENTVGGFVKLLISNDASIEIFSMHSHTSIGERTSDK
ncbi:MAG: DUF6375 family protein [Solirubrobacterales bacterium]